MISTNNSAKVLLTVFLLLCFFSISILCQNEQEEDLSKLSEANAFFAEKLYKQLASNYTNLIFSPMSVSVALSMLTVGAGGKSFEQLNSTLGFQFAQLNEHELLEDYKSLLMSLTELRDGYQFSLANALFVQNSFPIYPNYTGIIVDDFEAECRLVDFGKETETLAEINGWVQNATVGKIDSILNQVTPLDVMALLNAVYFKGQWLYQFNENETRDDYFTTQDGSLKTVKMMTSHVEVKYKRNHPIGGSVLELPYKGETFSMIFILPPYRSNLSNLAESLNPKTILEISEDLELTNVTVGIPKIKLESEVDLIEHLKALGIEDIFTDSADLHGISPIDMKVTQAKHKATIDINEEGSEASAVTIVVTTTRSGPVRTFFWADHPFLYFLRHNPTNTVCFMGKVADV